MKKKKSFLSIVFAYMKKEGLGLFRCGEDFGREEEKETRAKAKVLDQLQFFGESAEPSPARPYQKR